jgi:hypothetical protein
MKILADPHEPSAGLLDGGRRIGPGRDERFRLRGLKPGAPAHLVIRSAPEGMSRVRVVVNGAEVAHFELSSTEAWVERVVELPADAVSEDTRVSLGNDGPEDFVDYHVWATQ